MGFDRKRYYLVLLAALFVMLCCSPISCTCDGKKKDKGPGYGALTVSEGPQNGTTGGLITAGDTNVVMLQFTVQSGSAYVTINSVKITDIGDGDVTATGVTQVKLYHDTDGDAQYDSGSDIPLAAPVTFNVADRTAVFSVNRELPPNTTEYWMVLYDFGPNASGQYICTIADVSADISTTVGGKANIPQVPGGGTGTITGGATTAQANTLIVAEGPSNPSDSTITALGTGADDVPMLQFSMTAGANGDVTVTSITFSATGTGDESTDVTLVQLWNDTDNDGNPDTEIDTGKTYSADNGTVAWTAISVVVPSSGTEYYVLTYDFAADVNGTFRVEITDIVGDVIANVGGETIEASGTSPVSGPTITIDSIPPQVVRSMFEGADPLVPTTGDTIKVYFDEEITATGVSAGDWDLPNTANADSLGGSPAFAQDGINAVLITLDAGTTLIIPGTFDPASPGDGPSGIDVDASLTSIVDAAGNAASPLSPPGVDIKAKFVPNGNPVGDLEVNVLAPGAEQSGNSDGNVKIQYFVAAPDGVTVSLAAEFDDGSGFQSATEGSYPIFTDTASFDPSDTGDLRIYTWDAVGNFPSAGATGNNDPVTLRFTFDPGTPGDTNDDVVDEIMIFLDNKPQAVATRPYVMPMRKFAYLNASNSWVPGSVSTFLGDNTDHTWTFASVPAGSAIIDSNITNSTYESKHLMRAYFLPDLAGDYVLDMQVNAGSVYSDYVQTTVHVIGPDSYVGTVNAPMVDLGGGFIRPISPGGMGLDATPGSEAIFYHSAIGLVYNGDFIIRSTVGKIDVSTLPGSVPANGAITQFYSYAAQYPPSGDPPWNFAMPEHVDTFYNNATFSMACTNILFWSDGSVRYDGTAFRDNILFGGAPNYYTEAAQADLDPIGDLGVANSIGLSGRVCQVTRAGQTVDYWIVHALDTTGTFISSWVVETSGDVGPTTFNPDFNETSLPSGMQAYDVEVQLNTHGSNATTLWVTGNPDTGDGRIYYGDLGNIGDTFSLNAIVGYPGSAPFDMVIDDTRGYLFISDVSGTMGSTGVVSAIYAIALDTRQVVATVVLPGDYAIEELEIDTDTGAADTAMLFGVDSVRNMIHLVWVEYPGGGDPVLTCLPSIDAGRNPYDVVYAESVAGVSDVLFFSEPDSNMISSASGSTTPWVIDHAATAVNTAGDEQNADWAVDPVTGDLCMAYQLNAGGGIFFTRSADGGLTWSAPVPVDDGGAGTLSDPDIAVDPWGSIIVVWADDDLGDFDVWLRRSDDGGTTWDAVARKVNTDTDGYDQGNPSVAVDFLGNIIVAFESSDGTNVLIEAVKTVGHQRWTYFGPADSNIVVCTGAFDCTDPDIVIVPYDHNVPDRYMPDAWVAWSDNRATTAGIMANLSTSTTAFGSAPLSGLTFEFQTTALAVSDAASGDAVKPRAVHDSVTENVVVVWEQDRGNGAGIYIDEGTGTGFGTDVVVEEPADASSGTRNNPYVSVEPFGGGRAVAYESDLKNPGVEKDVYWEIMQPFPLTWDGEGIRMNNEDKTNDQTRPLVHMFMPCRRFVSTAAGVDIYTAYSCIVTWQDERSGGAGGIDFYSKRQ